MPPGESSNLLTRSTRAPRQSIRHAEAPADVARPLQLVKCCHGVVLEGDEALPYRVDEELVAGRAVFAGALARADLRGRAQVGPVEASGLVAPHRQRLASLARFCLVDL